MGIPAPETTHSSPLAGAYGARSAVSGPSLSGWVVPRYSTLPVPTLVYPPSTHPGIPTLYTRPPCSTNRWSRRAVQQFQTRRRRT